MSVSQATYLPPVVDACIKGVEYTVDGANALKNDMDGFGAVLETSNYVLMALEAIFSTATPITMAVVKVTGAMSVVDFFGDLISLTHYWLCGEFIDDIRGEKLCNFLGMFTLGFAIIGGSIAWLSELGFFNLGAIAATMGSIPVFGAVAAVGLAPILCGIVAVSYTFFLGDAVQSLVNAENKQQKIKACIDIVSRVASIALSIIVGVSLLCPMAPAVSIPLIVTFGLIAKGLGVVSFLYKHYNKRSFEN